MFKNKKKVKGFLIFAAVMAGFCLAVVLIATHGEAPSWLPSKPSFSVQYETRAAGEGTGEELAEDFPMRSECYLTETRNIEKRKDYGIRVLESAEEFQSFAKGTNYNRAGSTLLGDSFPIHGWEDPFAIVLESDDFPDSAYVYADRAVVGEDGSLRIILKSNQYSNTHWFAMDVAKTPVSHCVVYLDMAQMEDVQTITLIYEK